jgi:hypothetical protein
MDFIFGDAPKELVFKNKDGDQEIIFLYDEPSAEDKIKYSSAMASAFRDKEIGQVSIEEITKIQFEWGLKCLADFRTKGVPINISCMVGDSNYHKNWKTLIGNRAPELVIALCQHIFESGGFVPEKN